MQFAINWSPEAAELFADGKIQLDLYKCPNWPDVVNDAQSQAAAYIHFPIVLGRGQSVDWDFDQIEGWLATTDTRFVNAHVIPSTPLFPADISLDDLAESLAKEVQILVDHFGKERVIIENCPYFRSGIEDGYIPQGMEPLLFQHLTKATGCGFLLDVAHAVLTSERFQRDWQSYILALPVERIREMHITGIGLWSTGDRADHMPMTEEDWESFAWCMERIHTGQWAKPEVLAFEYGGIGKLLTLAESEKSVIEEQVPRLQQITFKETRYSGTS